MNKIKVLDIASTDKGAYTLLRTRVKKIQEDSRFDNYIVCPSGKWQKKMIEEGTNIIDYKVTRGLAFTKLFGEIKSLENIIYEANPDIVHSHNSKTGALSRIAVKKVNKKYNKNIKMIHQVHGYHFTTYKGIKRYLFFSVEKFLANFTDILLFQNKYELELSQKFGIGKKSKLIYIGNGINIEEFNKFALNNKRNDEYINIVCIARLEPVKNHIMLLEAIKLLIEKYNINNIKLILIGEGDSTNIDRYIEENKLRKYIEFTGMIDREILVDKLNNSDISVLTSIKEGKPRALIESLILGKPCVATDVVGTNEVVINNQNGYLVKLNDSEEFAKKLYELINDKNKYYKFSENAKKFAKKEFNENSIIDKLKEVYLKI